MGVECHKCKARAAIRESRLGWQAGEEQRDPRTCSRTWRGPRAQPSLVLAVLLLSQEAGAQVQPWTKQSVTKFGPAKEHELRCLLRRPSATSAQLHTVVLSSTEI